MGGRIEFVGEDAVSRGRAQPAIPLTFDRRAVRLDRMENLTEQLRGRGTHNDPGARRLLTSLADLHILEIECATHHQDRVEYLRQDQRIDDMTLQQDGLLLFHDRQTRTLVDKPCTDSTPVSPAARTDQTVRQSLQAAQNAPLARPQASENRRRTLWGTLRIFTSRERS